MRKADTMAQRIITVLVDDVDGGEAAETVAFSLDGINYEIDLSTSNAAALRRDFSTWIEKGRRVSGRKPAAKAALAPRGGRRPRSEAEKLRAWARENGYQVKDRGRVPDEIVAAYEAAN